MSLLPGDEAPHASLSPMRGRRVGACGIDLEIVRCREAVEAQDSQVIFMDPVTGLADEGQAAPGDIRKAVTGRIDDNAASVGIERVDGEIPAPGILADMCGIRDGGPSSVGRDVAAPGGDFERHLVHHDGKRAVIDPGGVHRAVRRLEERGNDVGMRGGGDIKIAHRHLHQGVAHGATHEVGGVTVRLEDLQRGRARGLRS